LGLRARGLVWVLGLTLFTGGAALGVLTLELKRSLEAIELQSLARDAQRLQEALDQQVRGRRRAASEWANWTELRNFVLKPEGSDFGRLNLSEASLQSSGLNWMLLLDNGDREVWRMAASGELPRQAVQARDGLGCGLARLDGLLQVVCRLPVQDSEGGGAFAGTLISGEQLGAASLDGLRRVLGLDFQLLPPMALSGEALPGLVGARLQRGEQRHQLRMPLAEPGSAPHSVLELSWPRVLNEASGQMLRAAQAVLVTLAVLLALASFALIDLGLVRRLKRLHTQMHDLRSREDWRGRLQVSGRDELSEMADEGNHLLARIETQLEALAAQSRTDALTGLMNRRGFEVRLAEALSRQARLRQPVVLALIDVDHFKRVNDEHGHAAGDDALRILADTLRNAARRGTDSAARWGGEEFVMLFEGVEPGPAEAAMQRLRDALHALPSGDDRPLKRPLRASAGLALARRGEDAQDLVKRADEALYRAKAEGRDRFVWAD
jgi:diguanylate cyclase (GGDEF)-like protein